jgi:hypothetical protein
VDPGDVAHELAERPLRARRDPSGEIGVAGHLGQSPTLGEGNVQLTGAFHRVLLLVVRARM